VQLVSQPNSALHLLDNASLHSSNLHTAESLLRNIQESCSKGLCSLEEGVLTTATRVPGAVASMALSVRQYLHVLQNPSLIEKWVESAVAEAGPKCEHLSMLMAGIGMCFCTTPTLLDPVFKAIGALAKIQPAVVRVTFIRMSWSDHTH
jgi:hypothetical protein